MLATGDHTVAGALYISYHALNATGIVPVSGTDRTSGPIPYWRLALQQDFGRHYVQFGTYGLTAVVLPAGVDVPGYSDRYTDTALDANYQFYCDLKTVVGDVISAHSTFIHERGSLGESEILSGTRRRHVLDTFRADVSYSFGAAITPTIQYFHSGRTRDAAHYDTPGGSPNSSGIIAEIAYAPWGKPQSFISWGNVRLALLYVGYFRFDGATHKASDNNALYGSIWFAAHF